VTGSSATCDGRAICTDSQISGQFEQEYGNALVDAELGAPLSRWCRGVLAAQPPVIVEPEVRLTGDGVMG
jgi:hypothetical protein